MQDPESQAEYYARRAREERAAADHAGDSRAAKTHRDLADQYDRLAHDGGRRIGEEELPPPNILPGEFRILP